MSRRSTQTFITTDPAGRITYDFQGHVHAKGLDIEAGTSNTPPTEERIRWLRASDGAMVAQAYAYENTFFDAAYLGAANPDNPTTAPPEVAYIEALVSRADGMSQVAALAGTEIRTVIASNGDSSFLQLDTPSGVKLSFGTVTFTFSGSALSDTPTVDHGLANTPQLVIVSNQFISGFADVVGYSADFTDTDFLTFGRSMGGPITTSIIHTWLAVG